MTTLQPTETDLTRFYALFPQPALARDLFNIIEGHRIDSAIRRAYPGIRRDMDAIQSASADRRPELGSLPESQAVAEALLQHTLGITPDMTMLPEATAGLITQAIGLLEEMAEPDVGVAAAAALTGRIYIMLEEHLADPSRRAAQQQPAGEQEWDPQQEEQDPSEQGSQEQPQGSGGDDEEYEPL